jgi:DNA (cytosine-5)-methyltransferase 1
MYNAGMRNIIVPSEFSTIEMCAGAGGQALGLHRAGFRHEALVEIDEFACRTLRHNIETLHLGWGEVIEGDLKGFAEERAVDFAGRVDLVAGGVPCPPFSKAGKQLGAKDERDLFPTALAIVRKVQPSAVMLENVAGLMEPVFKDYRELILNELDSMGYKAEWKLLHASNFGVPQLRPRSILVAFKQPLFKYFSWPEGGLVKTPTIGEALYDLVAAKGWAGATKWRDAANSIAPTLVGGSKKHGGPDLGPTRAKAAWQKLGVNAHRLAADDELPHPEFQGAVGRNGLVRQGCENMPLLNVRMAARVQGFPDDWHFVGTKTHAYRQVGNAFPPPVAEAVGLRIRHVLEVASLQIGAADPKVLGNEASASDEAAYLSPLLRSV